MNTQMKMTTTSNELYDDSGEWKEIMEILVTSIYLKKLPE